MINEPRCIVCGAPLNLISAFTFDGDGSSETCSEECFEIYMDGESDE